MSKLHLRHKLPWGDLVTDLATTWEDQGIELPIGSCGEIHCRDKKTEIQLSNRKYLADHVCRDPSCETVGTKIYRKNDKFSYSLTHTKRRRRIEEHPNIAKFISAFNEAVSEFAQSERNKVVRRVRVDQNSLRKEVRHRIREEGYGNILNSAFKCDCRLFTMLIEFGDAQTLLSFNDRAINDVLKCYHGGNIVGNNFWYLKFHLLAFYIASNLIIATNLQQKKNDWGCMRDKSFFRNDIYTDCDGQKFLNLKRYLIRSSDYYMVDTQATNDLIKESFKFLYFVEMLHNELGKSDNSIFYEMFTDYLNQ